jgi:hypothetical protein
MKGLMMLYKVRAWKRDNTLVEIESQTDIDAAVSFAVMYIINDCDGIAFVEVSEDGEKFEIFAWDFELATKMGVMRRIFHNFAQKLVDSHQEDLRAYRQSMN